MLGKAKGTVSAEDGSFKLNLDSQSPDDEIMISVIGYESLKMSVKEFLEVCNASGKWYLKQVEYTLEQVVVNPKDYKEKRLGNTTTSRAATAGLDNNPLGYEFGTLMKNRNRRAHLQSVKIDFADCSFDSIFIRMNVYTVKNKFPDQNILQKPLYLSYTKEEVLNGLEIDLRNESIQVDGNFAVTVELVKDIGEGHLYLPAALIGSKTFFRETSQANWRSMPIGVSISTLIFQEKL